MRVLACVLVATALELDGRAAAGLRRAGDRWRDSLVGRTVLLSQGKLHVVATTRMSTLENARDLYLPQYHVNYDLGPIFAVSP